MPRHSTSRPWPRLAAALASALTATTTVPAPAAAPASAHFGVCADEGNGGEVIHDADAKMLIASLSGSCDDKCTVIDPLSADFWQGIKVSGGTRIGCDWKEGLHDNGTSSRTIMRDTDAFTFPNTGWYYNGRMISHGIYVKIRDVQRIVCVRSWGSAPVCTG